MGSCDTLQKNKKLQRAFAIDVLGDFRKNKTRRLSYNDLLKTIEDIL